MAPKNPQKSVAAGESAIVWATESRRVRELVPWHKNPRKISDRQLEQLKESIRRFNYAAPVVINLDGQIIAGHMRIKALLALGRGDELIDVRIPSRQLAPKELEELAIRDNANGGEWDFDALSAEFDLGELESWGMDTAAFGLMNDLKAGLTDPDEAPELPKNPKTKPGQIFQLGNHRLICGDATSQAVLDQLLGGERAAMCFTDPPYLMDFDGAMAGDGTRRQRHAKIANDSLGKREGDEFLRKVAERIAANVEGAWYVCFYRLGIDRIMAALLAAGLRWRNLLIWKKELINLSNSDYKSIYEPIVFGWASDYIPVLYGWNDLHAFFGHKGSPDVTEIGVPSVWEISRTKKNDLHPTMKPVELCRRAIENSSRPGQTVLDLFGGSGSTLIAAEQIGRECRMVELEPAYCDVIIERWEQFTGNKAVLVK